MNLTPKDFVIARVKDDSVPELYKVTQVDDTTFSGIPEKSRFYDTSSKNISKDNVLVNLGHSPYPGKVYGADTSLIYRGKQVNDVWGNICYFYDCPKETRVRLSKAFARSHGILKKVGLDHTIDSDNYFWKIVGGKNRYAGMYESRKKGIPGLFTIYPDVIEENQFAYVLLHEYSHYLHNVFINPKSNIDAQWIKLFVSSIQRVDITKEESASFLETLISDDCSPSQGLKIYDGDSKFRYKWILRWISKQHGVSVKELDSLWEDNPENVKELWPDISISRKDLNPIISEYACKNYKETFAEALSFHLSGFKLPKPVTSLVLKTLSYIKSNS